jgi:hypothetical protein
MWSDGLLPGLNGASVNAGQVGREGAGSGNTNEGKMLVMMITMVVRKPKCAPLS